MPVTMTLLPSFLDANPVERVAVDICTAQVSRTTSGLTLATRKVYSKNLTRFVLSVTEKAATTTS